MILYNVSYSSGVAPGPAFTARLAAEHPPSGGRT